MRRVMEGLLRRGLSYCYDNRTRQEVKGTRATVMEELNGKAGVKFGWDFRMAVEWNCP